MSCRIWPLLEFNFFSIALNLLLVSIAFSLVNEKIVIFELECYDFIRLRIELEGQLETFNFLNTFLHEYKVIISDLDGRFKLLF